MKKIVKSIIFYTGKMFSCMYNYQFDLSLSRLRTKLYSGWISNQFRTFDNTSIIAPPFDLRCGKCICVGKNVMIGKYGMLTAWESYGNDRFNPEIWIGNNVGIGENCHISAINKIVIGNGVLMGKRVTIVDNSHGKTDWNTPPPQRGLCFPVGLLS